MLKIARKHPILCACAAVCVVSVAAFFVMAFDDAGSGLAMFAFISFAAACFVAGVVMNYRVFGGTPNSSIYRPGANPDDEPR